MIKGVGLTDTDDWGAVEIYIGPDREDGEGVGGEGGTFGDVGGWEEEGEGGWGGEGWAGEEGGE